MKSAFKYNIFRLIPVCFLLPLGWSVIFHPESGVFLSGLTPPISAPGKVFPSLRKRFFFSLFLDRIDRKGGGHFPMFFFVRLCSAINSRNEGEN